LYRKVALRAPVRKVGKIAGRPRACLWGDARPADGIKRVQNIA
jgi:hypothetical protein